MFQGLIAQMMAQNKQAGRVSSWCSTHKALGLCSRDLSELAVPGVADFMNVACIVMHTHVAYRQMRQIYCTLLAKQDWHHMHGKARLASYSPYRRCLDEDAGQ